MENFKNFLLSKQLIQQKQCTYYIKWVSKFFSFQGKKESIPDSISDKLINNYLLHLEKSYESWQVTQAEEALRLYIFYISKKEENHKINQSTASTQKWKLSYSN
jgi:hypothetical protein